MGLRFLCIMKKIQIPLLILLLASCSKSDVTTPGTTTTPPVVTTPTTPTTPTSLNVWQLTAISVNNVAQTLTPLQASFKMTLNVDGRYSDSDGVTGYWSNPTSDSLKINQTNLPTPIAVRFKIKTRTATNLGLTQTSADKTIELVYEAK